MTDKPIMIDDVDVADCIFYGATNYKSENCYRLGDKYLSSCRGYKDCYYKQLKRKEEECEELRDELEWVHGFKDKLNKEIEELNKELLQKRITILKNNDHYHMVDQTNIKLKQVLQEIKEIAEKNDELLQGYHKEWANNKLILQKISEVENV